MTDKHQLWRIVGANQRAFEAGAPDGYEAVVEVYLAGRAAPVKLIQVQTRKDEFEWTLFVTTEMPSNEAHPSDRVILARAEDVERVEVSFQSKGATPLGFVFTMSDGDSLTALPWSHEQE